MSTYFDRIATPLGAFFFDKLATAGVNLNGVTADILAQWYTDYAVANTPTPVDLEDVNPDFEEIFNKLLIEVSKHESWKDAVISSTGTMLIQQIAAGIVFNQTAVIRAAQETMLDTARLPNSIYAIARMLGVRILRKKPVWVQATLSNSNIAEVQVIPKYTQWSVGKYRFFNREPIIFNEGQSLQTGVKLYQGAIQTEEFVSSGQKNQRYEVGLENFTTSDEDLDVYVDGVQWKKVEDGAWRYPKQAVFADRTTAKGAAEIIFGDGQAGDLPALNATVQIQYARTEGLSGSIAQIGLAVKCLTNAAISGVTDAATQGGGDERDTQFYKLHAPTLYSSRNKAVTKAQYRSLVMTYEDVIDCVVQGQQDLDPSNPVYFNLAYISVLTKTKWNDTQWATFVKWIQDRSMIGVKLVRRDPTPVILDIDATVYCTPSSNLQAIQNALITHLSTELAPTAGSIGRNVFRSDIYQLISNEETSKFNVSYAVLNSPTNDVLIQGASYVQLRNVNITCAYGERK